MEPTRSEWRDWSRAIEPDSSTVKQQYEAWYYEGMRNMNCEELAGYNRLLSRNFTPLGCCCHCRNQGILPGIVGNIFG